MKEKGNSKTGRTVSVLFIILLMLVAVASGANPQAVMLQNNLSFEINDLTSFQLLTTNVNDFSPDTSATLLSTPGVLINLAALTSFTEQYPQPQTPNNLNIAFWLDSTPQPCWLGSAQMQGQGLTLNRVSSESKPNAAGMHRFVLNCKPFELSLSSVCSRNLLESSPPGLFLII